MQGAAHADQRGPDASQPPAPDGAVATVAPQERGLEMQPEERVTPRARKDARALAGARTDARIDLHSTRTKHTLIRTLSHSHPHARTHTRARSHAHVHAYA